MLVPAIKDEALFLDTLGGLEVLEKEYPVLHQKYQASKDMGMINSTVVHMRVDFMTYVKHTKRLTAHASAQFSDRTSGYAVLSVYEESNYALSIFSYRKDFHNQNAVLIGHEKAVDMEQYKGKSLVAIITIVKDLPNCNAIQQEAKTLTQTVEEIMDNSINGIQIMHPSKQIPSDTTPIKIVYKRSSYIQDVNTGNDYFYPFIDKHLPIEQASNIFLNFKGKVSFSNPNYVFVDFVEEPVLYIGCGNPEKPCGLLYYTGSLKPYFKSCSGGFEWALSESDDRHDPQSSDFYNQIDWHTKFLPELFGNTKTLFCFAGRFRYRDGLQYHNGDLIVTNTYEDPAENNMPYLQFIQGCLAGDTRILMSDKTEKPIRDVQPGESVAGPAGQTHLVTDISRGFEADPLYCIRVKDGRYIKATTTHFMKTERGPVPAGKLLPTDCIETQDGSLAPIEELFTVEENEVFNLTLETNGDECGAYMIANGVVVGDSTMQNRCHYDEIPAYELTDWDLELQKIAAM